MATFFTRTGDDGYTGVLGEGRVAKYDLVPEALGCIDEATASLGLARVVCTAPDLPALILQIQRHLYGLMAEVAATPENAARFRSLGAEQVTWLEEQTAIFSQQVTLPKEFIIPGDSIAGAALDVARTVVRRAERRVAELFLRGSLENAELLHYLNRLSSLIFVLEIYENQLGGGTLTLAKTER